MEAVSILAAIRGHEFLGKVMNTYTMERRFKMVNGSPTEPTPEYQRLFDIRFGLSMLIVQGLADMVESTEPTRRKAQ